MGWLKSILIVKGYGNIGNRLKKQDFGNMLVIDLILIKPSKTKIHYYGLKSLPSCNVS